VEDITDLVSSSSQNFAEIRGVVVRVLQQANRIETAHAKRSSAKAASQGIVK